MRRRRGANAGFTLLESLVAMTLMALLLAALMPLFRQGLEALRLGDAHTRAAMLAESLLAEAVSDQGAAVARETGQGELGEFRWSITRLPHTEDELGPLPEDSPLVLVEVTARVTWDEDQHAVVLRTLSLEWPP